MSAAPYALLLMLHLLGAAIWTGGHIVLALTVLPRALREKRAAILFDFEQGFERVGLPALAVQVVTGLWLAHRLLGSPADWFASTALAQVVQLKLLCLAGTVALAVHAKTRVLPRLDDSTLPVMAWHIAGVTVLSVILLIAGASIRFGGLSIFHG